MLELFFQFSLGFTIALSGALLPGPLLAFITMKTLESGPKAGTLAATGHIIVELGILLLAALGLKTLLKSSIFIEGIGLIGGILLLIFGGLTLSKSRSSPSSLEEMSSTRYNSILGGILFSTVLNPTIALWWMTLGLTFLTGAIKTAGLMGGAFWILGHFSADLGWFSTVSFSVDKGKEIIGGKFYRVLLLACGLILLVFGAYFIVRYLPAPIVIRFLSNP